MMLVMERMETDLFRAISCNETGAGDSVLYNFRSASHPLKLIHAFHNAKCRVEKTVPIFLEPSRKGWPISARHLSSLEMCQSSVVDQRSHSLPDTAKIGYTGIAHCQNMPLTQ